MLGLWSHRDGSPLVLLFRAGTAGQQRTTAAISGRELDLDDLVLAMVESRRPAHTRMPLGTSRRLLVPIKAKRYLHRCRHRCWLAISCLWIRGRVDELVARRKIVVASPVELPFDPDVVLDPNAAQDLDCQDFTRTLQEPAQQRDLSTSSSHLDR